MSDLHPPILEVKSLTKSFGALKVIDSVSLLLKAGDRHGIIGPNGAGKTTLFNLLSGSLLPDSGDIFLGGRRITKDSPDVRARIGLARSFQQNNLFSGTTVRDNLEMAALASSSLGWHLYWHSKLREQVEYSISQSSMMAGIEQVMDSKVNTLSYGVQRQVEIGITLATNPKILLLDEPTAGMSHQESSQMLKLINSLPQSMIVVIVEHDMDVLFSFSDSLTVLNHGSVLSQGPADEVRQSNAVRSIYLGLSPDHSHSLSAVPAPAG